MLRWFPGKQRQQQHRKYDFFLGRGKKRKNSISDDEDYSSNYYKPATNGNGRQVHMFDFNIKYSCTVCPGSSDLPEKIF